MGLETGVTYIEDLDATNPDGSVDTLDESDNHHRIIKTAIQGSFPSLGAAAVTKTAAKINDTIEFADILDEDDMASNSATDVASQQSIKSYIDSRSQIITAVDSTYQSTTSTIPVDDSIPVYTEGSALVDVVITPVSASSKLKFEFSGLFTHDGTSQHTVLTLVDVTGLTTLYATSNREGANLTQTITFSHVINSPATSANTYRVRFGTGSSGTVYANGNAASRMFGGVAGCRLTVTEIM